MDRRGFLKLIGATAGGLALERAIPFGRVWSFPKRILRPGVLAVPGFSSVRFVKAWSFETDHLIGRIDIARGCDFYAPASESTVIFKNPTRLERLIALPAGFPHAAGSILQAEIDERKFWCDEYVGVDTWIEEDS